MTKTAVATCFAGATTSSAPQILLVEWPYGGLSPLFDHVTRNIGGRAVVLVAETANQAYQAVSANPHIQAVVIAGIINGADATRELIEALGENKNVDTIIGLSVEETRQRDMLAWGCTAVADPWLDIDQITDSLLPV
ncbi:hypothetical protein HJC99_04400 [Candidatus Saccharibacteria bacterium]|nr:hypothetical protein [Candidatus Saccharibacteria bacterium]